MNPSRNILLPAAIVAMVSILPACVYAQAPRSVLGTVAGVKLDAFELDIKTPAGELRLVKWNPQTLFQRIAPGQKDLQSAQAVELTSIKTGDRVLVSLLPDGATARRVVVMAAEDISKKNQAEQEDWTRRGLAGVVTAKEGSVLKLRGGANVTVGEKTTVRRYAPDSVKFSDALPATAADIKVGDQIRTRGDRPDPASPLAAEEIVFGTFVTKAGTITEVRPEANEITITDMVTKKPLLIKITADSEVKRLPARPGMGAGGPGSGSGPGVPGSGQGAPGGMRPGGPGSPGGPGGGAMAGRPGGVPDPARMFERLPAAQLADLKPGETLLVSSTKGSRDTEVTAIKLLSNVDMIIQMARAQAAAGAARGQGRGEGAAQEGPSLGGGMGMGGGMGGFDLGGLGGGLGGPQ